jgi:uncharacterized protein YbjT (DUF2867 family)
MAASPPEPALSAAIESLGGLIASNVIPDEILADHPGPSARCAWKGEPGCIALAVPVDCHLLRRWDGRNVTEAEPKAHSKAERPILVTGAAGQVGAIGRAVVELLRQRGLPVRALVRRADERADRLRATGAEVVVGDLTNASDVAHVLAGCSRLYFGMSVSPVYLESTVIVAAAARERGELEAFVNISQMTVSQMTLTEMTDSPQHRQHLLAELVLNWSGLPVVHVRPTVFLENPLFLGLAARSIANSGTIRLPFGEGRTSPIAAHDVAEVIATILADPAAHIGKIYELTGPRSLNMSGIAAECSSALGRTITYVNVPFDEWREHDLKGLNLPDHVFRHILTMARLHADNRYDRMTRDVELITGRLATSVHDFVVKHADIFS